MERENLALFAEIFDKIMNLRKKFRVIKNFKVV